MCRIALLLACLALASCGGSKTITGPLPDPNAGMYGTWDGTMSEVRNGQGITWSNRVWFSKDAAAYYEAGVQYGCTVTSMADPNVSFVVTVAGASVNFTATRTGPTISGTYRYPNGSGGSWAATK